jgi:hypothetical protein
MSFAGQKVQYFPKKVGETAPVTFDFTSQMGVSETVSTQVVAATVYSGVDASPSAIISGSASASGKVVSQAITAGVSGCVYQLVCTITTSLSQTLQQSSYLAVVPDLT